MRDSLTRRDLGKVIVGALVWLVLVAVLAGIVAIIGWAEPNGNSTGAPVKLGTFAAGTITLHDLPASVNSAEMSDSLLGMAFLRQMRGYSVEGNTLTLKP